MKTDPGMAALDAIDEVMAVGSAKEGRNDKWRDHSPIFHTMKAIRHATTHTMILSGIVKPDGENHLKLAVTRLAMALAVTQDRRGGMDQWG